jgi:hypothetical protein
VVPAADGTTDFSVLQNELKGKSKSIVLVAFDLKLRQLDTAVHLHERLKSPGRRPPTQTGRREDHMINDAFDRRTIANMEVALERACLLLPAGGEKHRARRIIAGKIIECANRGETSLSRFTEAGYAAASNSALPRSPSGRKRPPTRSFLLQ